MSSGLAVSQIHLFNLGFGNPPVVLNNGVPTDPLHLTVGEIFTSGVRDADVAVSVYILSTDQNGMPQVVPAMTTLPDPTSWTATWPDYTITSPNDQFIHVDEIESPFATVSLRIKVT
jgi:hypothetical protein